MTIWAILAHLRSLRICTEFLKQQNCDSSTEPVRPIYRWSLIATLIFRSPGGEGRWSPPVLNLGVLDFGFALHGASVQVENLAKNLGRESRDACSGTLLGFLRLIFTIVSSHIVRAFVHIRTDSYRSLKIPTDSVHIRRGNRLFIWLQIAYLKLAIWAIRALIQSPIVCESSNLVAIPKKVTFFEW